MSIQGSLSGLEWAPGSEYESAGSFARPEHVNTKSFIDYIYTRVLAFECIPSLIDWAFSSTEGRAI